MIIFKTLAFILASWFLIHLLAIFGVFLALAYPVWWLLDLKRFPCLWCRIKKIASCQFSHSLLDTVLILIFTLFSFGLVFVESRILFKMGFPPTPKTVSFVIPSKGQYRLGEIFPLKIEVTGIKVPINAVQADLGFNPERLEIVNISTTDSFANIFIQKEINNEVGYARLTGGLPNPGFFSDRGLFGTVYFKGKSPGVTKIEFLPSSLVLANDGRGTNVLRELTSVSYLILPERISQKEEEMQKSTFLQSAVLGEKIESAQMTFYEEEKVLGIRNSEEIKKEERFTLDIFFLNLLEKVDHFILSLWGRIFSH